MRNSQRFGLDLQFGQGNLTVCTEHLRMTNINVSIMTYIFFFQNGPVARFNNDYKTGGFFL
ncbi:hypothetical protein QTP88_020677 [Uroleucon formosanum]